MTARTERLLWFTTLAVLAVGTWFWHSSAPEPLPESLIGPSAVRARERLDDDSLGMQVVAVVATDPFRLNRRPSAVPYGSVPPESTPQPRAVLPELRLAGVIGPPWRAMLDGVPGRTETVVVAEGDTLGGLRVRAIRNGRIELSTSDTTWTLTMRRTWQ